MAYNKHFNPDALPAHAEPEQAAQALGSLPGNRRPSPNRPPTNSPLNPSSNPSSNRPSPNNTPQPYKSQQDPPQQRPSYNQNIYQNQTSYTNNSTSNAAPQINARLHSPPPQGYGHGPPPSNPTSNLTPQRPSASPTPLPPPGPDADLYPLFRAANKSHTGTLTSPELSSALVNADYSPFDPHTIRTMMFMFSSHPTQSLLTFPEFQNLWRFLAAWRQLFERFDIDASGRINRREFSAALVAFGYRLSDGFVKTLFDTYARRPRDDGRRGSREEVVEGSLSFDLFVQACISLKKMTDVFKGYDEDRDGYVTLSFEEFLSEVLRLRE